MDSDVAGHPELLLILGGSLGAAALNQAMVSVVEHLVKLRPALRVVWQTGRRYWQAVAAAAVTRDARVCILP